MQFSEEEIDKLQKERDQKLEEATKSAQHLPNGSSTTAMAPTLVAKTPTEKAQTGKTQTATSSTIDENTGVVSSNVDYSPGEGSEVYHSWLYFSMQHLKLKSYTYNDSMASERLNLNCQKKLTLWIYVLMHQNYDWKFW